MFFDDHERFYETSEVFSSPDRLNLRHEALFTPNTDILEGARVLDIASHDGRWTFAALAAGAAHVTGIEARPEAVAAASDNLRHYGADPAAYDFICGDIFDELATGTFHVDVVLCLGFLYHTYRHTELLHRVRAVDPVHLVVDTSVVPGVDEPFVRVLLDRPDNPAQATLDPYSHGGATLVGRPTAAAVRVMLNAYDFEVEHEYDWPALLGAHPDAKGLRDYRRGARVSIRSRSRAA